MTTSLLIARRELVSYLVSPLGYLIIAIILLADGLLFNAFAMTGEKRSFDVLQAFFYFSSGTTMVASIFISMRLFAEEKQTGTIVLLETSPASEQQIVLGKFLGAWGFLLGLTALTVYMPLLVLVNGKVTVGHLATGYLGLALLGAATTSIGTLASSLARSQVLAAVMSGAAIVTLLLIYLLAKKIEGPVGDVLGFLDLFDKHFRTFSRGTLKLGSVAYYVALTYTALLGTTAVLSSRRWRG